MVHKSSAGNIKGQSVVKRGVAEVPLTAGGASPTSEEWHTLTTHIDVGEGSGKIPFPDSAKNTPQINMAKKGATPQGKENLLCSLPVSLTGKTGGTTWSPPLSDTDGIPRSMMLSRGWDAARTSTSPSSFAPMMALDAFGQLPGYSSLRRNRGMGVLSSSSSLLYVCVHSFRVVMEDTEPEVGEAVREGSLQCDPSTLEHLEKERRKDNISCSFDAPCSAWYSVRGTLHDQEFCTGWQPSTATNKEEQDDGEDGTAATADLGSFMIDWSGEVQKMDSCLMREEQKSGEKNENKVEALLVVDAPSMPPQTTRKEIPECKDCEEEDHAHRDIISSSRSDHPEEVAGDLSHCVPPPLLRASLIQELLSSWQAERARYLNAFLCTTPPLSSTPLSRGYSTATRVMACDTEREEEVSSAVPPVTTTPYLSRRPVSSFSTSLRRASTKSLLVPAVETNCNATLCGEEDEREREEMKQKEMDGTNHTAPPSMVSSLVHSTFSVELYAKLPRDKREERGKGSHETEEDTGVRVAVAEVRLDTLLSAVSEAPWLALPSVNTEMKREPSPVVKTEPYGKLVQLTLRRPPPPSCTGPLCANEDLPTMRKTAALNPHPPHTEVEAANTHSFPQKTRVPSEAQKKDKRDEPGRMVGVLYCRVLAFMNPFQSAMRVCELHITPNPLTILPRIGCSTNVGETEEWTVGRGSSHGTARRMTTTRTPTTGVPSGWMTLYRGSSRNGEQSKGSRLHGRRDDRIRTQVEMESVPLAVRPFSKYAIPGHRGSSGVPLLPLFTSPSTLALSLTPCATEFTPSVGRISSHHSPSCFPLRHPPMSLLLDGSCSLQKGRTKKDVSTPAQKPHAMCLSYLTPGDPSGVERKQRNVRSKDLQGAGVPIQCPFSEYPTLSSASPFPFFSPYGLLSLFPFSLSPEDALWKLSSSTHFTAGRCIPCCSRSEGLETFLACSSSSSLLSLPPPPFFSSPYSSVIPRHGNNSTEKTLDDPPARTEQDEENEEMKKQKEATGEQVKRVMEKKTTCLPRFSNNHTVENTYSPCLEEASGFLALNNPLQKTIHVPSTEADADEGNWVVFFTTPEQYHYTNCMMALFLPSRTAPSLSTSALWTAHQATDSPTITDPSPITLVTPATTWRPEPRAGRMLDQDLFSVCHSGSRKGKEEDKARLPFVSQNETKDLKVGSVKKGSEMTGFRCKEEERTDKKSTRSKTQESKQIRTGDSAMEWRHVEGVKEELEWEPWETSCASPFEVGTPLWNGTVRIQEPWEKEEESIEMEKSRRESLWFPDRRAPSSSCRIPSLSLPTAFSSELDSRRGREHSLYPASILSVPVRRNSTTLGEFRLTWPPVEYRAFCCPSAATVREHNWNEGCAMEKEGKENELLRTDTDEQDIQWPRSSPSDSQNEGKDTSDYVYLDAKFVCPLQLSTEIKDDVLRSSRTGSLSCSTSSPPCTSFSPVGMCGARAMPCSATSLLHLTRKDGRIVNRKDDGRHGGREEVLLPFPPSLGPRTHGVQEEDAYAPTVEDGRRRSTTCSSVAALSTASSSFPSFQVTAHLQFRFPVDLSLHPPHQDPQQQPCHLGARTTFPLQRLLQFPSSVASPSPLGYPPLSSPPLDITGIEDAQQRHVENFFRTEFHHIDCARSAILEELSFFSSIPKKEAQEEKEECPDDKNETERRDRSNSYPEKDAEPLSSRDNERERAGRGKSNTSGFENVFLQELREARLSLEKELDAWMQIVEAEEEDTETSAMIPPNDDFDARRKELEEGEKTLLELEAIQDALQSDTNQLAEELEAVKNAITKCLAEEFNNYGERLQKES